MGRGRIVQTAGFGSARPDYHQLVVFLKVVERRSFSGAAKALNRTQPAISQAIMRLEEICGANLFQRRRGASLTLSPVGEAIVVSARTVVDAIDQQLADAITAARGGRGKLTLGFAGSLSANPLCLGIAEFVRHCPDAELTLVEREAGELDRQLLDGDIDLAIAPRMPNFSDSSLCREALWEEPLWCVLPATHDLAHRSAITWAEVSTTTIILGDRHGDPVALFRYAEGAGVGLDVRLHRISRAALLDVIGCGIGATIVAQSEIAARSDVVFRPIDEADATISFDATWLTHDANPLRHRLLNTVRRHSKSAQNPVSAAERPASDRDPG